MRIRLLVCALTTLVATMAFAQQWSEGFEAGPGLAKSYREAPPQTTLEVGADDAAEGDRYVRGVLPGRQALEGLNVRATGLRGGRVATVTAQVRGSGELWLCLISGNGWLYSPTTVTLTDQWQDVSLDKVLVSADTSLGIHFLSKTAQQGAAFEVDDVQVLLADPPQVYDADVGPWRFEAEDFPLRQAYVGDEPQASGGLAALDARHMALVGLPFPRTSKPVTVYLRVKPVSVDEAYRIETRQAGHTERLSTVKPTEVGTWQWLAFAPVRAGEVGDSFTVALLGDKEAAGKVAFDQVALSTRADLTPEELAAAPFWGTRRPLSVVARAASAPTIDGRGDDVCWRNTVACTGFVGLRSLPPAQADTSVRLCYDEANLYLLVTCREPILNVAGQRRGQFVAKIAERDADVYHDDSVIILLDPADTGEQVFDFTINALGTVADAHAPGPNLWDSRDLEWDSGTRAEGHIGEDVWTVEMAIPFEDLGGAPRPGDTWQAGLGRIAKARKETTSWHPARAGFHDPVQLGTLLFGGATPGVELTIPAALQPGENALTASLSPLANEATGVYLYAATGATASRERSRTYGFTALTEAPQEASLPFTPQHEGELQVEYAALNAATLQPLVRTPLLPRAVKSSIAQVRLACDGPYELHLNDQVIGRGDRAGVEAIAAPLQRGANVFALRLDEGTAAIAVEAPGSRFTAESWKIAPADTEDATDAGLDDRSWPMAKSRGTHPQLGPGAGEPGKAVVLRRTLLWEKTRVWPTPKPAFHLARGATQHFTVITDGLPGKILDGWTTYIATPPEFEVVGSTGFYGTTTPDQPEFVCTPVGTQRVGDREMRVVKVVAEKPVRPGRHYIMSLFEAHVRYRGQADETPDPEPEFVYWSEANGGSISEPPQSFKVRLVPKLAGIQPKTLVFQLWGGWFSNIDDEAVRHGILQCAQAAGFNDIVSADRWTSDHCAEYGIRQTLSTNFKSWGMNLAPYLEEHPDERLMQESGEPHDSRICMTLLLGDGWEAVEEALAGRLEEIRPHTVDIDYEYGPYNGPHSCYCPRCLAAFREVAGLAPDVALDAETIQEQHAAPWIDFMARRVAEMFAKFNEAIHRLAPGTEFSIYSGYQTPANPEMYGIDWRYVGELQACDRAGAGYGEGEAIIARTVEALQGIPLLCGMLSVPYDTSVTTPLTPLTKAGVLRMLLAGSGGILVFDRKSFDGRTWSAVAEVSRLAATHEDVFVKGKPSATLPGLDPTQGQILSEGRTTLICVMNPSGRPVERTIGLPDEAGPGEEFYSGQKVEAGQQVTCSLAPGDAAVYVLRR